MSHTGLADTKMTKAKLRKQGLSLSGSQLETLETKSTRTRKKCTHSLPKTLDLKQQIAHLLMKI